MAGQQGQPKYGFGWPDGCLGGLGPAGSTTPNCNSVCKSLLSAKLHCTKSTFAANYKHLSYKYKISQDDWFMDRNLLIAKFKAQFNKDIQNDWTESMENTFSTDCIYLDYQNAFDSVPHRRLISKLRSYKINECLVNWVEDYLQN